MLPPGGPAAHCTRGEPALPGRERDHRDRDWEQDGKQDRGGKRDWMEIIEMGMGIGDWGWEWE